MLYRANLKTWSFCVLNASDGFLKAGWRKFRSAFSLGVCKRRGTAVYTILNISDFCGHCCERTTCYFYDFSSPGLGFRPYVSGPHPQRSTSTLAAVIDTRTESSSACPRNLHVRRAFRAQRKRQITADCHRNIDGLCFEIRARIADWQCRRVKELKAI